jgi:hypothetical protein
MLRRIVIVVCAMVSFAAPVGAIQLESWDNQIPSATLRF